jgi:hypothetical protein
MMSEEQKVLLHQEVIRDSNDWGFIKKLAVVSMVVGAIVFTLIYALLR